MSMNEFFQYVTVIRKRWWLFAVLCGTALGAILVSAQLAPPQYESSVRFLVNVPPSADVTLYPGYDRPTQNQKIGATQAAFMEVLRSPIVVGGTIKKLGLSMSIGELQARISVEKPTDSEFPYVAVTANKPEEAAEIANTLVQVGKDYYGQILSEPTRASREFISAQVAEAEQKLQETKQALVAFKTQHDVTDLRAEIESQRTVLWNLTLYRSDALASGDPGRAAAFDKLIAEHRLELRRLTSLSDEYESLNHSIASAEAYYDFLVDKETEAKLKENEASRTGFIQVVEPAYPPTEALSPYDVRLIALGLAVSLVVSTGLAFTLEYLESQRRQVKPLIKASQASD